MIIKVTGVNRWNKGAELMIRAIKDRFAIKYPKVKFAVDHNFGQYGDRAMYGLLYNLEIQKFGRSRLALSLMPDSFKKSVGLVHFEEIDAVLDASGFAFGDQHPPERTIRFADEVHKWRSSGKPVVLLPQALGPFETPLIRDAFTSIVKEASHVFARDPMSLAYAEACGNVKGRITLAPDFTNLVAVPEKSDSSRKDMACIVPNQRMIEKATDPELGAAYVPMLCKCIEYLKEKGVASFLLIHGSHDATLIEPIQRSLGYQLEVVRESDPVEIKWILGQSFLVIGSRFHALVSALSQTVPSIATSWSHKYEMLFKDYGCHELVMPVDVNRETIEAAIDGAIGEGREALIDKLKVASASLKGQSREMWNKVDELLGLTAPGEDPNDSP